MTAPSREAEKSIIRFPPGMRDELKELAQIGFRSVNAEIVARLRRDIDREKAQANEKTPDLISYR